ncbi:hypothetical protein ACKAV7_014618 [Fusarium commune]
MGLPQRYDKVSYKWCLDWKQMGKQCRMQEGSRDWTKEEMMAYLDWSKAEDDRVEAQVAAEMEGNPFSKRRGMREIWEAAAADCEAQEALYSGSRHLAPLSLVITKGSESIYTIDFEAWKQMAKAQQETVKEITTSHERIIETLWNAWKKEQQVLKQMIEGQETAIRHLQQDIQAIQAHAAEERKLMQEQIDELKRMQQHASRDIEPLQVQAAAEIKHIHEKLDIIARRAVTGSAQTNPRQSFADIARVPPTEGPSGGVRRPEPVSPPAPLLSSPGEDLFCTIDISGASDDGSDKAQIGEVRQAIEAAVRIRKKDERWRCAAVIRGARNANIIKVICRDEAELHMVREAALGADMPRAKILRERLYPVKINGANRSAVLDSNGNLLPGVTEALGQENEVTIAKMNWLSDKGNGKVYGSMVVYVTMERDARRLLEHKYFHLGGESARTSVFEPRAEVVQCYNCWGLGHKAFVCKEAQRCGRCAERGHYHRQCEAAEPICEEMSTRLQVYQLNVRKNDKVHLSMMNDKDLRDYVALAVAEPWACIIEGQVMTVPNHHNNWTKMIPTKTREPRVSRWPIRSMLWIRRDLKAEQVPIPSPDLTAAIVRFPERDVLVVSVYVEGRNEQALEAAMGQLHTAIAEFRNGSGRRTDVILIGDFNRHDTLWGGDEVTGRRQGEAGPIIELMGEHGLHSLLPRGTKTWEGPGVLDAIDNLVPRAKPSPYAKRWWTTDLTRLRRMYTYWRNQARACRRRGREAADPEQKAREAAKEYHDAIRRQKKAHWDSFLEDGANIWQSAKYLSPGGETMGDKIPPLKRRDGTTTSDKAEQAEELLSVFFPPLPAVVEDEERRPAQREITMPELTLEEVEEKVMAAKAWKAPGEDGLPAMVWKQLWPRSAKIIPLKKPGKDDYKVAKSWRPISLLSTLGKMLEAVIVDRISKKRSAEQALLLLQEHIYKAWRNRKVLSLISFDVKGAYNGVFKDRLLQRLEARGIPKGLVKWIDVFCSNRSATIVVNGYTSERRELPQAGLPQGSDSGCRVTNPPRQARSTRLRVLVAQRRQRMMLPEGEGGYLKRLDKALPGKHTCRLYDALKRRESDILVQLRTGMARVNRYLHRIGAAETDTCDCGQEEETVEHFLFRCPRWDEQREHMRNVDREMIGNLSFFLGGKTAEDGHRWSPNLGAVQAVIRFAISTGRWDATKT